MAGLGIAIAWVGYATLYYGVTQIQGGNFGFLDLILPGRWALAAGTPYDNGSSATVPASPVAGVATPTTTSGGGPTKLGPTQVNPGSGVARTPGLPVSAR